jgi:hypothetical protein
MMSASERCQQEQRLAQLFSIQREATERKDWEGADAFFRQIWALLNPEPRRS